MQTSNLIVTHGQSLQHQDREIQTLKDTYATQNKMIENLKTTQQEQGQTITQMNTVQQDLVTKINLLVQIAQRNEQPAEDRTAARQDDA